MDIKPNVVVIGLGGIGSNLVPPLARLLATEPNDEMDEHWVLTLIDGDSYEPRNADRQVMPEIGNKAEVTARSIERQFPNLVVIPKPWYIDSEKMLLVIEEGTIVILCVDKHPVRRLVSDFCEKLDNIILISGGNDLYTGNVQVFVRERGKSLTAPLTLYHPEIRNAKDEDNIRPGCQELAEVAPQLIATNFMAAAHMLAAFYRILAIPERGEFLPGEIYFSIVDGNSVSYERSPTEQ